MGYTTSAWRILAPNATVILANSRIKCEILLSSFTEHRPYCIEGLSQKNLTFVKKVVETLSVQNLAQYLIREQQFFTTQLHYKTHEERIASKEDIRNSQTTLEMHQKFKPFAQNFREDERKLKKSKKHLESLKITRFSTFLSD